MEWGRVKGVCMECRRVCKGCVYEVRACKGRTCCSNGSISTAKVRWQSIREVHQAYQHKFCCHLWGQPTSNLGIILYKSRTWTDCYSWDSSFITPWEWYTLLGSHSTDLIDHFLTLLLSLWFLLLLLLLLLTIWCFQLIWGPKIIGFRIYEYNTAIRSVLSSWLQTSLTKSDRRFLSYSQLKNLLWWLYETWAYLFLGATASLGLILSSSGNVAPRSANRACNLNVKELRGGLLIIYISPFYPELQNSLVLNFWLQNIEELSKSSCYRA